ncbi:hypothetical protein [Streptomyces sp. NPDC019890]|uniref:hypothetical protein n=1 Tax=Streptomyces sp. NPDC019890 TaxID=3365064 RepID=UPI00384E799A
MAIKDIQFIGTGVRITALAAAEADRYCRRLADVTAGGQPGADTPDGPPIPV